MNWLKQMITVLALNLRTIPSRLSLGGGHRRDCGVVVVFVSVLSIAAGFRR